MKTLQKMVPQSVVRAGMLGLLLSALAGTPVVKGQDVALKTNLLYWGTTTPNLGLEWRMGRKTTGQVFYGLNPWKQSGGDHSSLRHWLVMPELRHWFCQAWNGWFVGVHALGGQYNAGGVKLPFGMFPALRDHRYKGWYVGGGVTAGYQWPLSRAWSFEAALGLGYIYSPYDRHCVACEGVQKHRNRNYVGPTKAALTLVYVFSGKQRRRVGGGAPELATLASQVRPVAPAAQKDSAVRVANSKVRVLRAKATPADGRMSVTMDLNLDDLRLRPSQQLVYTPIVHTPDSDIVMPEIILNGSREQKLYKRGVFRGKYSPNVLAVGRKNGKPQTVSYMASVPLQGTPADYELRLREDLCGCGDTENDSVYNIYKYEEPAMPKLALVHPKVEAVKIRHLDRRAYIDFPVDRTELHPDYRRNPAQLDSIISTIDELKSDKNLEVTAINIHGYASPESPYEHNAMLARGRAKTLADYVRRMVKLPAGIFSISSTPEDWDGLRHLLSESNLEHRQQILDISRDERLTPDAREWKIKTTYPEEYQFMLHTWYPALRHSDYRITYKVRPFNVEEAKKIIKTRPQQLSLDEMFMVAQTYEAGSEEFNNIMLTAAHLYPADPTANLNAAIIRLNAGDADGAKSYLDKAGTSDEARQARALYEALKARARR